MLKEFKKELKKKTVYTGNDEKLAETIANQLTTSGCTVIHKTN